MQLHSYRMQLYYSIVLQINNNSGHAATSIGLLTYLLLEVFVYHPNIICGLSCQKRNQGINGDNVLANNDVERNFENDGGGNDGIHNDVNAIANGYFFQWGYGWRKQQQRQNQSAEATPGYSNGEITDAEHLVRIDIHENGDDVVDGLGGENANVGNRNTTTTSATNTKYLHHWYALLYFALLFPVPFSRVYLHDHYANQVLIGSAVGIVSSVVWYLGVMRGCVGIGLSRRMEGCISVEWREWWRGDGLFQI